MKIEEGWRILKDEECMMKDDDFKLLRGFGYKHDGYGQGGGVMG